MNELSCVFSEKWNMYRALEIQQKMKLIFTSWIVIVPDYAT